MARSHSSATRDKYAIMRIYHKEIQSCSAVTGTEPLLLVESFLQPVHLKCSFHHLGSSSRTNQI
ncbi:unnamed protein product [Oikopleura dioica]|uniref:Uncharacterized protein n=1 Tax=Oikopleura dioica TaxID=34765 RepID=E4WSJ6_OIKDI|nr:unnamed protein product [Oikopleura dioica]CBY39423.1 unnamed protein product [Oikopleura dioica]